MSYGTTKRRTIFVVRLSSFVSLIIQAGAALLVVLLLLRFGMRALGVRPDVALPGMVYGLTAPLTEPFYRLFPLPLPYGERFDVAVIEPASLVAAGVVIGVALVVYVVGISYLNNNTSQGE